MVKPLWDFEETLKIFDTHDVIAIDTETNADDIRDGRGYAIGVSLACRIPGEGVVSAYLPFRHQRGLNLDSDSLYELKQKIESFKGYLIFHNAKFDLVSLGTLGINYPGKFYDTMQIAHLLNEELPYAKSLDSCVKFYCKDVPGKKNDDDFKNLIKLFGWGGMPVEAIEEYAKWDAVITYLLAEQLVPKMREEGITEYWDHKQEFYRVIIAMESYGVKVDTDLCKRMVTAGEQAMEDVVEILGLNPGSPIDLRKLLIDKLDLPVVKRSTKTDKASFDKEAMAEYELLLSKSDDPTAQYILAYRGWQKSVSSNYRAYLELLSPDGRLRPNYKLHGTKTGRMSCEKPNLQQIPRISNKPWNGELKHAFIAEEGYTLYEADYGQLELRLAAAYAREQKLITIFNEGRDVFTEMSKELGMARHDAKTLTYTIQYGGGISRLSSVFGFSRERAKTVREQFFTTYPGFRAVSSLAQRKAVANGSLKLWSGRRRHFLYPQDEAHKGFNSIIQGGAADIVERTMSRLFREVNHPQECRMLLQVHDSILFEVKDGLEDKYLPLIQEVMENVVPDFGVKFAVDLHPWTN